MAGVEDDSKEFEELKLDQRNNNNNNDDGLRIPVDPRQGVDKVEKKATPENDKKCKKVEDDDDDEGEIDAEATKDCGSEVDDDEDFEYEMPYEQEDKKTDHIVTSEPEVGDATAGASAAAASAAASMIDAAAEIDALVDEDNADVNDARKIDVPGLPDGVVVIRAPSSVGLIDVAEEEPTKME